MHLLTVIKTGYGETGSAGTAISNAGNSDKVQVIDAASPEEIVSAIKEADGKYVNIMLPGDRWDGRSLETMLRRIHEVNSGRSGKKAPIRIFSSRLYVERESGPSKWVLDYKYKKNATISIVKKYQYPEYYPGHLIIERKLAEEVAREEHFESRFGCFEFVQELILKEGKYDLCGDALMISDNEEMLLPGGIKVDTDDEKELRQAWDSVQKVVSCSMDLHGSMIKYVQNLILLVFRSMLRDKPGPDVSPEFKKRVVKGIRILIRMCDNNVIIKHRKLTTSQKAYLLKFKGSGMDDLEGAIKNIAFKILDVRSGMLHMEGTAENAYVGETLEISAKDENGASYGAVYKREPFLDIRGVIENEILPGYSFTFDLPLRDGASYEFFIGPERKLKIKFGKFSRLTSLEHSYFVSGSHIISTEESRITIEKAGFLKVRARKKAFDKVLKQSGHKEALSIRNKAHALAKSKKPIVLITDRTDFARDNGEALFEYMIRMGREKDLDIRFVISEESEDFERLKGIGKVVPFGSDLHKALFLAAKLVVSSSGDEWVMDPFGDDKKYYRDLITAKYVFLQHGVIVHDLSEWLSRFNKNISLFVCSGNKEYESITSGAYGYDESVAKLTGLPRFDKLEDRRKKVVAFLPTWRKDTANKIVPGTSKREYIEGFKDSEFYRFYNRLINDERVIEALTRNGYRGVFYLHPSVREQARDFNGNDVISVWDGVIPFSEVFSESAMLVTDYSSVATDFAYLRKPVLYLQYDEEEFFRKNTYDKGYFDYEEDGFGPVYRDYEESADGIVKMLDSDCALPEKFGGRAERFFGHSDRKNSERVAAEIDRLLGSD